MEITEEQKEFQKHYEKLADRLDEIIEKHAEQDDNHNTIICEKLHALEVITGAISDLVTIAKDNHHGRNIFANRILDVVSSMHTDADSLLIEIRRDIQEELS